MKAESHFVATGQYGQGDQGQKYICPDCGTEVLIRDSGSLFMGVVYSLFWSAVGLWALIKGPIWYIQHSGYFSGDYGIDLLLFDGFVVLLALAVAAFSCWIVWTFLLKPLRDRVRFPIVGEIRERTETERKSLATERRDAVLSLLVYPLGIWIVLIGLSWGLETLDVNIKISDTAKFIGVGLLLAGIFALANKIGIRAYYFFVGLVFWLAIIVLLIFSL